MQGFFDCYAYVMNAKIKGRYKCIFLLLYLLRFAIFSCMYIIYFWKKEGSLVSPSRYMCACEKDPDFHQIYHSQRGLTSMSIALLCNHGGEYFNSHHDHYTVTIFATTFSYAWRGISMNNQKAKLLGQNIIVLQNKFSVIQHILLEIKGINQPLVCSTIHVNYACKELRSLDNPPGKLCI